MLNFLGIGSAFNTKLGNNSAFIKNKNSLLLIDCGGNIFSRIREIKLLEDVKEIYVLVTHTHPDHVGSLGDLIFYSFYILHIKVKLFFPQQEWLVSLLLNCGIDKKLFEINSDMNFVISDDNLKDVEIDFKETSHVSNLKAYSLFMKYQGIRAFYSGDTNVIDQEALEKLERDELDLWYQDIGDINIADAPHLPIHKLADRIKDEYRSKVHCMHFDEYTDLGEVEAMGFGTVKRFEG